MMEMERNIEGPRTNTSYFFHYTSVLGQGEMELAFFLTACNVSGFGFVTKLMMITHQCSGCC